MSISIETPPAVISGILLNLKQIEMRRFGKVKIYTISPKIPFSQKPSFSSEYVMQIENNLNILFVNEPFLNLLEVSGQDLLGENIELTVMEQVFGRFVFRSCSSG